MYLFHTHTSPIQLGTGLWVREANDTADVAFYNGITTHPCGTKKPVHNNRFHLWQNNNTGEFN